MENIVYDYNNTYYDDSSDSPDSSDSSSDSDYKFNTGLNYYPIITNQQFNPFSIYEPTAPVTLSKPIASSDPTIPVHFDLKDTFNMYNKSMDTLTNNINKTINIYGGYYDENKAREYNKYDGLYTMPKINTTPLKKFIPLVPNSYLFPIDQKTADMVNSMNDTIKTYDAKYKEMLQYHSKYMEGSREKFQELVNTKLE